MEDLRLWLANELRRGIPDDVWEILVKNKYAKGKMDDEERELLVEQARMLTDAFRAGGGSTLGGNEKRNEDVQVNADTYEADRSAAYSTYLAKLAEDDRRTRDFRQQELGGNILTEEQAEEFLKIPNSSLEATSRILVREHSMWSEESAALFLLTGTSPEVICASGRIQSRWSKVHNYGVVILTVEPWVTPNTVRDLYKRARENFARQTRKIKERHLAMFNFVLQRLDCIRTLSERDRFVYYRQTGEVPSDTTEAVGPSFEKLMREWNESCPDKWKYTSRRNFARDFRKTERRIANPVSR